MLKIILFSLFVVINSNAQSVVKDSVLVKKDTLRDLRFNYKQLIIPSVLISYGFIGLESHYIKNLDSKIRNTVFDNIDEKVTIDDFAQYAPGLSVYALNMVGIQGKNNLRDRTIILGTSYAIMSAAILSLKSITKVQRPDVSSINSFPSGHTATAFLGAEFLYQEYKDKSVWYGIAGYVVATGTGIFRIVNNRHWLTDVAAGAGIGILSVKIAYWVNPYMTRKIFGEREKKVSSIIVPFYNGEQVGFGFAMSF